ncbi:hypothetical protein QR90_12715 [Deinococcus radiopugnans]|uniref:Uncharacterized protein n=1 Tax=Deinococcus radiopugnans TaxID=57497 RepID=A0A0A7KKK3_9DEIO|nr:hypothetical protein [Deinococcus radiopugnans]AIZ45749.1 hypothetical protein QR90_12715 [Deinococcus radiopugnans]
MAQLLADYGLICRTWPTRRHGFSEVLLKVQTELGGRAAEWADTKAGIEQSADALGNIANAVPYANLAAFPSSVSATKPALALDTGKVYAPGGGTWGNPIGQVVTAAKVAAAQATATTALTALPVLASKYFTGNLAQAMSTAIDAAVAQGRGRVLVDVPGRLPWTEEVYRVQTVSYVLDSLNIDFAPECVPVVDMGLGRENNALIRILASPIATRTVGMLAAPLVEKVSSSFVLAGHGLVRGDFVPFDTTTASNTLNQKDDGRDFTTRYHAQVESVSGDTVQLDAPTPDPIPRGSTVVQWRHILNFKVDIPTMDFNGKYGFGVLVYNLFNGLVHIGEGRNCGNRVGELSQCYKTRLIIDNAPYGFDVEGDGGHSYVARVSVSKGCLVTASGSSMRHIVDFSGGSGNIALDCRGTRSLSADVLTHGNGARNNNIINLVSRGVRSSGAISFDPDNGDTGDQVIGGSIDGVPYYRAQRGQNTLKGQLIRLTDRYGFPHPGLQIVENAHIVSLYGMQYPVTSTPALEGGSTDQMVEYRRCTVDIEATRGLMTSATSTNNIITRLIDCVLTVKGGLMALDGGANSRLEMQGGRIILTGNHGTTPPFNPRGGGYLSGVTIESQDAGTKYLVGLATFGTANSFEMDRCTITAAHPSFEVFKPLELNPKIILGQNTYSPGAASLGVYSNRKLASIGMPILPNAAIAQADTWDDGSQFGLPTVHGGLRAGWVRPRSTRQAIATSPQAWARRGERTSVITPQSQAAAPSPWTPRTHTTVQPSASPARRRPRGI